MRGLLLVVAFALTAVAATAHAETIILHGGAVYTLNAKQPWASAVVLRDGRIAYVGDDAGARAFASGARSVALKGRMVLPGFHDAHIHPMTGGMRLLRCRLGGARTKDQLYTTVRVCARERPAGAWLLGNGWPEDLAPALTRAVLDTLAGDRPAVLTNEDGYKAWVNTKALNIAGVDAGAAGVIKGEIYDRVRAKIPQPTEAEYREALRRSTAMANAFGITSIFDASAKPAALDAYRAADNAGELTVRVVAAQLVDAARGPEQVDAMVAARDRVRGKRFRADAAKIFVDGVFEQRTAAMLAPYEGGDASGDFLIAPDALRAVVTRLDREGFYVHMHAMGDRAVRAGLEAVGVAIGLNGVRERRHQIAHVGLVDPGDLAGFNALGVAAVAQPLWAHTDDPAFAETARVLGPERTARLYPFASLVKLGARLVASSDWPAPSMNPLDAIQVAMTRRPLDGAKPAMQPDERVDLATMLAAFTINAAWAAGDDAETGSLEVGKAADVVVIDRNLFELDAMEIHKARVLLTLLDGAPVYRDKTFAWPASR